jgi:hypothetical protein
MLTRACGLFLKQFVDGAVRRDAGAARVMLDEQPVALSSPVTSMR